MALMDKMTALSQVDADGMRAALDDLRQTVGARFFWHYRPYDNSSDLPRIVSNFSAEFIERYVERRCQRVDPVITGSLSSNVLQWWTESGKAARDPLAARVMAERFGQGCSMGISLGLRGVAGQFSILSLWANDIHGFRTGVEREFALVHTFAIYLHAAAFNRQNAGDSGHVLSDTELELLKWTAVGKTAWEISVLVSLPERTVHYHLAEASRKLGAPNKTAAVCIALKAGLLGHPV